MAITDVVRQRGAQCTLNYDYKNESASETYRIYMDSNSRDFPTLLKQAQSTTSGWTNPLPLRGRRYPHTTTYPLFVESYNMQTTEDVESCIEVQVTYTSTKDSESDREKKGENPLLWPAEYTISWIEEEYVIENAYNAETLGPPGKQRQANTWGPVVNGALQEFDEPLVDTRRNPVLHITYNVADLFTPVSLNAQFEGTTNSQSFLGAEPRRCKYLVAETSGRNNANGVDYYQMTINIAFTKTTERILNNIGWNFRDTSGELAVCKVKDDDSGELVRPSEPIFLKADGTKASQGTAPTITYRYLREVDYGPLLPAHLQ